MSLITDLPATDYRLLLTLTLTLTLSSPDPQSSRCAPGRGVPRKQTPCGARPSYQRLIPGLRPGYRYAAPDGAGSSLSHSHSHCPLPILNHPVARQDEVYLENTFPVARPLSRDSHPRAAAWRPCPGLQTFSPAGAGRKIEELKS